MGLKALAFQKIRRLIFAFYLLCLSASAHAFKEPAPEIPKADEVRASLENADDIFEKMYVSKPVTLSAPNPKLEVQENIIKLHADKIREFIQRSPQTPGSKKILIVRFYGLDDLEIADLMIEAKKKGITVWYQTDFNQSADYDFKSGETHSTDFKNFKFKGEMGRVITHLLNNGFEINGEQASIFSQPLFNRQGDDEMIDIFHHKDLMMLEGQPMGKEFKVTSADLLIGTANLNNNERYNRVFHIRDTVVGDYFYRHAQRVKSAFQKGKFISGIESLNPLKYLFKDGSSVEFAFTDGKYNLNDRQAKLLEGLNEDAGVTRVLERGLLSHFVFTFRRVSDAINQSLKIFRDQFKLFGLFDDRYVEPNEPGQTLYINQHPR